MENSGGGDDGDGDAGVALAVHARGAGASDHRFVAGGGHLPPTMMSQSTHPQPPTGCSLRYQYSAKTKTQYRQCETPTSESIDSIPLRPLHEDPPNNEQDFEKFCEEKLPKNSKKLKQFTVVT